MMPAVWNQTPVNNWRLRKRVLFVSKFYSCWGTRTSEDQFVCNDAPTLLKVLPAIPEACPGETINFSAVVSNMNGETLPVEQVDLRWASDSPDLLTVDSESGVAKTLEAGNVFVNAESEVCGQVFSGVSYVRIGDVPDIKGSYSVVGSETVRGCEFDEDNGTFGGSGTATVTFQDATESMDTDIFAGAGSAPGLGESFEGTVQCNGAVSGTGTYTESEPCGENDEETCITSGTSTFNRQADWQTRSKLGHHRPRTLPAIYVPLKAGPTRPGAIEPIFTQGISDTGNRHGYLTRIPSRVLPSPGSRIPRARLPWNAETLKSNLAPSAVRSKLQSPIPGGSIVHSTDQSPLNEAKRYWFGA